jgi:prophage regulatory protein
MAARDRNDEAETDTAAAPDKSELRRMVSEQELLERLPFSRSTLLRMEKAGTFPKSIHLSPNRRAWFLDAIIDWQRALAEHDPHFDPNRRRGRGRQRVSDSST